MKKIFGLFKGLFGKKEESYKMFDKCEDNKATSIAKISTHCGDFFLEKIDTNGEILLTGAQDNALKFHSDSKIIDILEREQYEYILLSV